MQQKTYNSILVLYFVCFLTSVFRDVVFQRLFISRTISATNSGWRIPLCSRANFDVRTGMLESVLFGRGKRLGAANVIVRLTLQTAGLADVRLPRVSPLRG